ncbi:MAG: AbrB/MazE/SpoVT family DNA-binding domain-containing protein [Gemmatimonadota bacterium]|jgi:putative addiction module antidote|nr:AbrB/MazE/SpoVT family DNA-binding domain-containing protein [Gemmatimonadota bacterium]
MARQVKETVIRAIGNSAGVTIPKAMLEKLQLEEGDAVYLVERDGGVLLTPHDPKFEEAMDAYQYVAKQYRNALRELSSK